MTLHRAALLLFVGCALAGASAQLCASGRQQSPTAVPINVTAPDTMRVSVQGTLAVSGRIGEALRIREMPAEPIWESNFVSALGGAAIAILAVFLAQRLRDRADERRTTTRLVTRIRSALETAAATARSILRKKDRTMEINPEAMNGIILEWGRYDRVSDDIRLLNNPQIEENVDNILGHARAVAEAILEDERRFREAIAAVGVFRPGGASVDPSIVEGMYRKREQRLAQLKGMGEMAQGVLEQFDAKWRPAIWHKPREVPE